MYLTDIKGRNLEFKVNEGASFDDLVKAGKVMSVKESMSLFSNFGRQQIKKVFFKVSFNNPDELGKGKELVDKVSGLIAVN